MGIPRRSTPKTNPAPPLPRYVLGNTLPGHPGMPSPCTRSIFSSSVNSFNTISARSSGESLEFIHGWSLALSSPSWCKLRCAKDDAPPNDIKSAAVSPKRKQGNFFIGDVPRESADKCAPIIAVFVEIMRWILQSDRERRFPGPHKLILIVTCLEQNRCFVDDILVTVTGCNHDKNDCVKNDGEIEWCANGLSRGGNGGTNSRTRT